MGLSTFDALPLRLSGRGKGAKKTFSVFDPMIDGIPERDCTPSQACAATVRHLSRLHLKLSKSKKSQDKEHYYYQTYYVNDAVHCQLHLQLDVKSAGPRGTWSGK